MATSTPNDLHARLRAHAASAGDGLALIAPGRDAWRTGELDVAIDDLASALVARGARAGDAIVLLLPNGPEAALAFLAVTRVATCAPINPALRVHELEPLLDDLAARAILLPAGTTHPIEPVARARGIAILRLALPVSLSGATADLAGGDLAAADAPPRFGADVALVLHTSGTTARPKMVPLTHGNLAASATNVASTLELTPDDRGGIVMPLFHIHGLVAALCAPLLSGGSVVCPPGFVAPDVLRALDRAQVTWLTAVPTMLHALLDRVVHHGDSTPSKPLRFLRSSSSPLPPAVLHALEAGFGAPVVEAYGMTEAAHQVCSNPLPPAARRPGSVGRPAGPDVAIVDGEIVIRGTNVMAGYVGVAPDVAAAAFTDGWFRTGDLGRFDDDGYLVLTGRSKEMINRAGEKIAPREVDDVLLAHPAVAHAICFSVPDRRLGEQVAAAVVATPGARVDERDVRAFAAQRLAAFKVPRRVVVLDEIPTGPTGKPQRVGLAARLGLADLDATGDAAQEHIAPRDAIETLLAEWWCETLDVTGPGVHDHFIDLGGDSVLAAKLVTRVERELAIELDRLDFFDAPTIATQARVIAARLLADDT